MGYDMQEGTLIRWLKAEGSNVDLGEPVAEIETDKAVVEFESYASGVLREILVPEGSTVPVGEAIAVVGDAVSAAPPAAPEPEPAAAEEPEPVAESSDGDGGDAPSSSEDAAPAAIPLGAASEPVAEVADAEPEQPAAPPAPARRVLATPIARQMAQDAGIDLADVDGSGPGGRIVREDVESLIAARQAERDADAVAEEPTPEPVADEDAVDMDAVAESEADDTVEESAEGEETPEPEIAAEVAVEEDEGAEEAAETETESEEVAVAEAAAEAESDDEEAEPEIAVEIAVAASDEDGEPESDDGDAEESEPEIAVEIAVAVSVEDDESDEEAEPAASFEIAVAASDGDEEAEPRTASFEIAIAASDEDEEESEAEEAAPVAEAAISEPEVADGADAGLLPLSRTRRQIARVTTRSKSEKPHFYVNVDVDMTDAMALRSQINAALSDEGVRVTVNDMIIAASAIALRRYPKFNAYYEEGGIRMNDGVNVGVAMALEEGLIMPAIVGAGGMSLKEIARASKDLSDRAQRGALSAPEYSGGTFAISNMGMMGVTGFVAIIQPPQTAVLAVGAVQKRAMVSDDDQIAIRQMMTATLSADHRIVDGAEGAMFVNEIKSLLENPLSVIL